jgi:hypothetical protein
MRRNVAPILGAALVLSPLEGVTQEKQIVDVKELAGRRRPRGTSTFMTASCDIARRERSERQVFP